MSFYIVSININFQIPNKNLSKKSAFEPGLLFLRERCIFLELVMFHCFCQTLIPECGYRP